MWSCAARRKPPVPGGGIHDRVVGVRLDAVDHRGDQRARGEVLPGPGLHVLRASLQERLVRVTLDVGTGARPVVLVDQVDDQLAQRGRIADLVLGLLEDPTERTALLAQLAEDVVVPGLRRVTLGPQQRLPVQSLGNDPLGTDLSGSPARRPS
jgi:hypothetical protein